MTSPDPYELLGVIGHGPSATVYRAAHQETRKRFAIKVFREEVQADPARLGPLLEGARQLQALADAGPFVRVHEVDAARGRVVMDLLAGDLGAVLARGALSGGQVHYTLHQTLTALALLHGRQGVHGAIKPTNLLLDTSGRVRLADGAALGAGSAARRPEGSAQYLAPELIDPAFGPIGPGVDLYQLGFTALELLAGPAFARHFRKILAGPDPEVGWLLVHTSPDFRLPPLKEFALQIPPDVASVLGRLLRRPVAERYREAREALAELKPASPPVTIPAVARSPVGPGPSSPPPAALTPPSPSPPPFPTRQTTPAPPTRPVPVAAPRPPEPAPPPVLPTVPPQPPAEQAPAEVVDDVPATAPPGTLPLPPPPRPEPEGLEPVEVSAPPASPPPPGEPPPPAPGPHSGGKPRPAPTPPRPPRRRGRWRRIAVMALVTVMIGCGAYGALLLITPWLEPPVGPTVVDVESEPAGATVSVRGEGEAAYQPLGTSPGRFPVPAGAITLRFEADGHKAATRELTMAQGKKEAVWVKLPLVDTPPPPPPTSNPIEVVISSVPAGASVQIDTTQHGVTPVKVKLIPGRNYWLELTRDGYETRSLDPFVVSPGVPVKPFALQLASTLENTLEMKLLLIRPGVFRMGSPPDEPRRAEDEGPAHEVRLTRVIFVGATEVTQAQFEAVMGRNPSRFRAGHGGGREFPLDSVTHAEAVEFCRRLGEQAGEKKAGRTYRLPTEAEWEFAARAGTPTPFPGGTVLTPEAARFNASSPRRVGVGQANPWGLFDTAGNVGEWCADVYSPRTYARSGAVTDPEGPAATAPTDLRVVRGGSWQSASERCRSAARLGLKPTTRNSSVGFRVVCVPPQAE